MNIDQHFETLMTQYQRQIDAEAALEAAPITAQEVTLALTSCTGEQFEQVCEVISRTFDAELKHLVELLVMQERDK